MADFTTPEFLENYDADDIYVRMRGILPQDIDSSEGSHTWNLLMPTAMVASELCEYVLPQVIQLIFPEWSYGDYLDAHAQTRGMSRKAAIAATGEVTITGIEGTVVPAGTMFSTPSLNEDDPSMTYETTQEVTIPTTTPTTDETTDDTEDDTTDSTDDEILYGSVTAPIECTEPGAAGNAAKNTVIFLDSSVDGIESVTNPAAITGGTDEETDEALIERIMEYDQTQGDSFVGNVADYKRWAMSVSGIGNASVIPANDNTGTVQIVLTDTNGDPASEALCTDVYDYIMSPDNPEARLAPINAVLDITTPTLVEIAVQATVELTAEAVLEDVSAAFLASLTAYMPEAQDDGEVKITRVAAILSGTEGVNDFDDLQIGKDSGGTIIYGDENIQIDQTEMPTITASDIALTEGTVG